MKNVRKYRARLIFVFKQLFLNFLKIHMGKKMYKNTYNIV